MVTAAANIGPEIDGSPSLHSVAFDLASVGYAVHEHLVSGTAASYSAAGALEPDGRWDVEEDATAEFTTRFVVHRPSDPARANGTVIVEWLNVTGGLDIPAVWMAAHRHLLRDGFTWVGVTTQRVGLEGGGMVPGMGLRHTAPDRYAALHHPGDAFSFDIFTQVVRGLREMLPERYGVRVDRVIATGASQSAFHLTTYVNAVDGRAEAVDGFLLQGRAGRGAPLEGWVLDFEVEAIDPQVRAGRLSGRDRIRSDARVPVMVVQSETDIFGSLRYLPARQPDSEHFRLWEVAGSAHCDTYFLCASPQDSGTLPVEDLAALIARADASGMPAPRPINSGPQMHFVLQRAFDALVQWTGKGVAPPSADRIATEPDGTPAADRLGIARGGVRSPWVDAPLAVLSGLGQPGFPVDLFGTTAPFDAATRAELYPRGRDDFVERFAAATDAAVTAGFLLEADATDIVGLGAAAWDGAAGDARSG